LNLDEAWKIGTLSLTAAIGGLLAWIRHLLTKEMDDHKVQDAAQFKLAADWRDAHLRAHEAEQVALTNWRDAHMRDQHHREEETATALERLELIAEEVQGHHRSYHVRPEDIADLKQGQRDLFAKLDSVVERREENKAALNNLTNAVTALLNAFNQNNNNNKKTQ
jgi:hypothetical protein